MKLLSEISLFDLKLPLSDKDLLKALNKLIKCINSRDIERRVKWMSESKRDHLNPEAVLRVWNQLSSEHEDYKNVMMFLTSNDSNQYMMCLSQLMQRVQAKEITKKAYDLKLKELKALRESVEAKYCRFTCFTLTELAQISMMLDELHAALLEVSETSARVKQLLINNLSEVSMLQSELRSYVELVYFENKKEIKSQLLRGSTGQMFVTRNARKFSDPDDAQVGESFLLKMKIKINAIVERAIFPEKKPYWRDDSVQSKAIPLHSVFCAERRAITLHDYFMRITPDSPEGSSDIGEKTPELQAPHEDDIFDEFDRMSPSEFLLPTYSISKPEKKSVIVTTEDKLDDLSDQIDKSIKVMISEWDRQFDMLVAASVAKTKADFAHSAPSATGSHMMTSAMMRNI